MAHSLRGAAASIGANSVSSIANRIESALREGKDVSEDIIPLRFAMHLLAEKLEELSRTDVPESSPESDSKYSESI